VGLAGGGVGWWGRMGCARDAAARAATSIPVVRCRSTLGQECRVPACSPEGLRVRNGARMGSAEDWLEPGERVMFRTGLHPMAFAGALSLALFVALVVLLLIRHNDLPPATEAQIVVVGALGALVGSGPALLRWRHTVLL